MAPRGWNEASVSAEPWWHRAVFYRIDPARFQATGSRSTGDLAGITFRLNYLQLLGVDALVLEPETPADETSAGARAPFDPDALESLIREASRHNLRVLLTLPPALAYGDRTLLRRTVHEWLADGAAGIALPEPPDPSPGGANAEATAYGSLIALLAEVLRATPGDRVLLTGPAAIPAPSLAPAASAERPPRGSPRNRRGFLAEGSGRLTTAAILPADPTSAAVLRSALITVAGSSGMAGTAANYPLLRLTSLSPANPSESSPSPAKQNTVAAAAALLASRGAAFFDFGAEIGLNTGPRGASGAAPLMQWTPTNIQQVPIERRAPAPLPAPGQPIPLGPYKPFVRPPPRSLTGTVPGGPAVDLDRNLPPPPPDPDTLPGFTTGTLPVALVDGASLNVATQDRVPGSVLNAFRDLLALRLGNPALRAGGQVLFDHDAEDALVFIRRPPAGAGNAGAVIVAANLGNVPVVLSLSSDLAPLGLHPGPLRALFSYGPQTLTGESTTALRLPPHAVFVGELRRPGR